MEKTMYALTFCYGGVDDNDPFAQTIAVSEDRNKLIEKMNECVKEDMEINEDDEWDDSCNFNIFLQLGNMTALQHNKRNNLYVKYEIRAVEVL
jgi:hypothetical protein